MKTRTLIVDDELLARERMRQLLLPEPEIEIVGECSNGREAVGAIQEQRPELIFLDVQMPELDGFGVLQSIGAGPMPVIVFVTAHDKFALRAFEFHAVDYLLKPFDKKRVAQAVLKARTRMDTASSSNEKLETLVKMLESQQTPTSKILIKSVGRMLLVNQKDICHASIEEGIISIVTSGSAGIDGHSNCRTLEELLESLDPNMFWRAHRSYLVNINHIREVVPWFKSSYQLRMDDKKQTEIPVSRAQTKRLRELFGL